MAQSPPDFEGVRNKVVLLFWLVTNYPTDYCFGYMSLGNRTATRAVLARRVRNLMRRQDVADALEESCGIQSVWDLYFCCALFFLVKRCDRTTIGLQCTHITYHHDLCMLRCTNSGPGSKYEFHLVATAEVLVAVEMCR